MNAGTRPAMRGVSATARRAARAPAAPGTIIAPGYRALAHLSRGKRLDVYDAWSEERDSRCVLKTLRPDRAQDRSARRALELEGRLLRRLAHPHLVRAYAIVEAVDGRPVVVLETLGGETVSHLLHRLRDAGTPLAPTDVAMLGRQLCSVVGYLHRHGLLHRDIKPSNVVADGGRMKLIDLSLVRRPGRAPAGAGTFQYMAPEQARGGLLTEAADVWGIGAVLFAALADGPPFGYDGPDDHGPDDGEDAAADVDGLETDGTEEADGTEETEEADGTEETDGTWPQLEGRAPRLADRAAVPPALATLVDACLEPDAAARPTVAVLAAGLDAWLDTVGEAS